MDMKDIQAVVKLAVDRSKGSVLQYTPGQADDVIRQVLIEANHGKEYLDYRDVRDNKMGAFYTIVENIIQETVVNGLTGNEFFNNLVETKVVNHGEKPEFIVEGNDLFTVAEVSGGNQGIRRQRLTGSKSVVVPTYWLAVKVYEELERILAGKASVTDLVNGASKSYQQEILQRVFTVFSSITADDLGGDVFVQKGSFDVDAMLDLIEHVEAETGAPAIITTTKKGARKLPTSYDGTSMSNQAKDDLYGQGYFGKFYGTPIVITPQRHKVGSKEFIFDDNTINVVASNGKPIKSILEGAPIMNMDNPMNNPDMVQNYLFAQKVGIGFVSTSGCIGRYEVTA